MPPFLLNSVICPHVDVDSADDVDEVEVVVVVVVLVASQHVGDAVPSACILGRTGELSASNSDGSGGS
jgi:hypothetical protein